jgi:Acetyltransferases, including N-acetylases of ribosomal proteins
METERLLLRHWKAEDKEDYALYASDLEVMLSSGAKPCIDNQQINEGLERLLNNENAFAIVLKETGKVIGGIKFQDDGRRFRVASVSIGYELAKAHWGKGYMPEAVKAMIFHAFEEKKVEVVSIGHFTVNEKSRRVIEKCGFKYEGIIRSAYKRFDGVIFDDVAYSILKEDYENNREFYKVKFTDET